MSAPTEEQINHLQSLLEAGEKGKWRLGGCSGRMIVKRGYGTIADVEEVGSEFKDTYGNTVVADTDILAHAKLILELHNLAPALLEAARENLRLRKLISRLVNELPIRRDWLDPQLEAEMKTLGKEVV